MKIKKISAHEILDSRGNPTVETEVELENGLKAKASVPSGASTGIHEAVELRDNDKKRYGGLGVLKACANVNKKIAPKLADLNVLHLPAIDKLMLKLDGTANKKNFGANAILSVSAAVAKAGALASKMELYKYLRKIYRLPATGYRLPVPMFNIINGGKHADSNLDVQEFMIVPLGIKSFSKKLEAGSEIFHTLGKVLKQNKMDTDVGNEGGYAPNFHSTLEALELIVEAIKRAGYQSGKNIYLALDVGASEIYNKKKKVYEFLLDNQFLSSAQLIQFYLKLIKDYPLISIEDGLAEDDWQSWTNFMRKNTNKKMMLVGDDLFTTNPARLKIGIKKHAANAVILKPNQIGTVTEAVNFGLMARKAEHQIITSHRSGETNDDLIADLAVALNSQFAKFGAPSRGERLAKYNRLLEIERQISSNF